MTQKDFNEDILQRLDSIQKKLPNGEISFLIQSVREMKEDVSELKQILLNPETGVIVKNNKNSDRTLDHEERLEELEDKVNLLTDLAKFRENVTKALWIIFSTILAIITAIFVKVG